MRFLTGNPPLVRTDALLGPAASIDRCASAAPALAAALAVATLLALATLLPACARRRNPSEIPASGHIEATEVRVSTKIGGTLLSMPHAEGDTVRQGEQIAVIDSTDVHLALLGARADRDQAEADLRLKIAGSRVEDIKEAEAGLARAQSDLDSAERDLERMQALLDAGSATTKNRDDARSRRDQAASAVDAAREQYLRRKNGSRPEEIDSARARLAAADARVQQLAEQVRDCRIEAPISGTMTEKLVEAGELLSPGTALCVITDLSRPWLTAYVGEEDLGRIRLGQEADLISDSGAKRKGRITFIAGTAEFTPKNVQTREERVKLVYKVKISIDNRDGLFKSGMPVSAVLHAERS
jgi:HlyD family secretion protein